MSFTHYTLSTKLEFERIIARRDGHRLGRLRELHEQPIATAIRIPGAAPEMYRAVHLTCSLDTR